ncbi:TPA: ash family protein [Klebsiella quasipneumoniae]|nr:ash family protein [Klebsiella quasipneumoniae]
MLKYSFFAAAKSVVGIGLPELKPRQQTRRERVFYCRSHSYISMVGCVGALRRAGWFLR